MTNESAKKRTTENELESLDLYPKAEAKRRTDAMLRAMLNTPPAPFTPKKPKKHAKK